MSQGSGGAIVTPPADGGASGGSGGTAATGGRGGSGSSAGASGSGAAAGSSGRSGTGGTSGTGGRAGSGGARGAIACPTMTTAAATTTFTLDGNNVSAGNVNGLTFKGFGVLSANGTSAVLMDYKSQHPEAYATLLKILFGGTNPVMTHVKIEMGNDRNNSTGPDPATMRLENGSGERPAGSRLSAGGRREEAQPESEGEHPALERAGLGQQQRQGLYLVQEHDPGRVPHVRLHGQLRQSRGQRERPRPDLDQAIRHPGPDRRGRVQQRRRTSVVQRHQGRDLRRGGVGLVRRKHDRATPPCAAPSRSPPTTTTPTTTAPATSRGLPSSTTRKSGTARHRRRSATPRFAPTTT